MPRVGVMVYFEADRVQVLDPCALTRVPLVGEFVQIGGSTGESTMYRVLMVIHTPLRSHPERTEAEIVVEVLAPGEHLGRPQTFGADTTPPN